MCRVSVGYYTFWPPAHHTPVFSGEWGNICVFGTQYDYGNSEKNPVMCHSTPCWDVIGNFAVFSGEWGNICVFGTQYDYGNSEKKPRNVSQYTMLRCKTFTDKCIALRNHIMIHHDRKMLIICLIYNIQVYHIFNAAHMSYFSCLSFFEFVYSHTFTGYLGHHRHQHRTPT